MAGKPITQSDWTRAAARRVWSCALLKTGGLRFLGCGVLSNPQGWVKGKIADQRAVTESILGGAA